MRGRVSVIHHLSQLFLGFLTGGFFVFACPAEPPFSALIFIELIAKLNNREREALERRRRTRERRAAPRFFFFCGNCGDG